METFSHWITNYGYAGLFACLVLGIVGLPIPDETLLSFAGYLVFKHKLNLKLTILTAFIGTTCGITVSYLLGRSIGLWLIHKYGKYVSITDEKMQRTLEWFDRVGKWSLPVGYFIPGVRHLTAYVAGAAKLQPRIFAAYAYTGGLLWSLTFIMLGYFLGRGWEKVPGQIENKLVIVVFIGAGLLVLWFLWTRFKKSTNA